MKRRLRRVVVHSLQASGVLSAVRRRPDTNRAVILRYHSVSDWTPDNAVYRDHAIAVAPGLFDRQMGFLSREYHVVTLSEIVERVTTGEPFPPRAVAITFDDGYLDNYVHALPVLRKYGLPAVVFVTTGAIGDGWSFWVSRLRALVVQTRAPAITVHGVGNLDLSGDAARGAALKRVSGHLKTLPAGDARSLMAEIAQACGVVSPPPGARRWMMDWPELMAMSRSGVEIGAHTHNHPILTQQTVEVAGDEIERSRRILTEGLGHAPAHFAYPNGSGIPNHDEGTAALVRNAGFASASTSINGPVRIGADAFRLRRVGVSRRSDMDGFVLNLERDRLLARRLRSSGRRR